MQKGQNSNDILNILSKSQKEIFYSRPSFSKQQQEYYFNLNKEELLILDKYRTIDTKIHFILLLGYFKYGKMFYEFSFLDVKFDVQYIVKRYFTSQNIKLKEGISKNIKTIQRNEILELTGFKRLNEEIRGDLIQTLKEQISIDSNPLFVFDKLVLFCENNCVIIPEYTTIQRIIGNVISNYELELFDKLDQILNKETKKKIEKLLFDEIKNQKILTTLKTSSKGFNTSEIEIELDKKKGLEDLYLISLEVIKELNLQNATIKYLYTLVLKYKVDKISSWKNVNQRYLYVLCFINYRYKNFNDNLVITFQSLVGKYRSSVIKEAQDKINAETKEIFKDIAKFDKILSYLDDKTDYDEDLFKDAKEKFFKKMLPKENFSKIRKQIVKVHNKDYKYQWKFYDSKYPTIRRNLRPLIKNLNFSFSKELIKENEFKKALECFQNSIRNGNKKVDWSKISINWIPKMDLKYLYENKKFLENRLEIYIYNTLKKYIKSNEIFFEDSLNFKSFQSDLIPIKEYFENRKEYHKKLNIDYLNKSLKKILKEKIDVLKALFFEVNENILKGKNSAFKQRNNSKWHLKYFPKNEKFEDNLFSNIPMKHLIEIMIKVQKETNFLSGLKHIAKKGFKREISEELLIASIFTCGTNIGPYNMEQSSDFSYEQLDNTIRMYLRKETLSNSNQILANVLKKLPIYKYYNIETDVVHSSSDGQKFNMDVEAFNSRYSYKYFGNEQGVSVLSLIGDFQPLASKIISANEYEGHYVLELLLMNESEIQPDKHSTDNHGTSNINFALMDFFGFKFCPRFKTLDKYAKKYLAYPGILKLEEDFPLKPNGQINLKLILEYEEEIKRVITSIGMKRVPASTIVQKLYNLPYNNKLKMAFLELNKLIGAIFILEYIDNQKLREDVQKSLNRGEYYHKLKKKVFSLMGGRIRNSEEYNQEVYESASLLLCSIIVYYNATIQSELLKELKNNAEMVDLIQKSTPYAWNHINFLGEYNFKNLNQGKWFDLKKLFK